MATPLDTTSAPDPVVVIGAGPVGLAAAAHLHERGLPFRVVEQGPQAGAAIAQWGHTRLFSPWEYNIDTAARRLLERHDWSAPQDEVLPTGHELSAEYLAPLAATPEFAPAISYDTRVVAISRLGMDKTRTANRATTPFIARVEHDGGTVEDIQAAAVIDSSGTWSTPNPLGQAGLIAPGEYKSREQGLITQTLPDVLGRDRERFAGKHILVVGAGHSAAKTLLELGEHAEQNPELHQPVIPGETQEAQAEVQPSEPVEPAPARGSLFDDRAAATDDYQARHRYESPRSGLFTNSDQDRRGGFDDDFDVDVPDFMR